MAKGGKEGGSTNNIWGGGQGRCVYLLAAPWEENRTCVKWVKSSEVGSKGVLPLLKHAMRRDLS